MDGDNKSFNIELYYNITFTFTELCIRAYTANTNLVHSESIRAMPSWTSFLDEICANSLVALLSCPVEGLVFFLVGDRKRRGRCRGGLQGFVLGLMV
jgi:hypothetical protein